MKRIEARETARLLNRPLAPMAKEIVRQARTIENLRARKRKLRKALATVDLEIRECQRMLRLAVEAIEPMNEGELS